MIKPEIFLKIGQNKSQFVSLLEVEKIETDFYILHYAVKRGFITLLHYSYYQPQ